VAVGDNSDTARSGMSNNNLLPGSNLSTKIVGNQISYSMKQINNVWDSLSYRERTLLKIFKHISDNCRSNGIPKNVIDYSQVLFTMAYEKQKKLKKGNRGSRSDKLEGLIGGCIYYSCKGYNINRSHEEIATICNVDKSVISYGSKLVFRLLHSQLDLNKNHTTFSDFIDRYAFHLNLEEDEIEIIRECSNEIYQLQILDNSKPSTLVAVAIYLCSNLYDFGLDKLAIAEHCHTTEPTINKNYKILLEYIEQIIV
jgi:transcription initiation factor TFIIIB Brf1 subunit/transcription initiation factor TFIIB